MNDLEALTTLKKQIESKQNKNDKKEEAQNIDEVRAQKYVIGLLYNINEKLA